MMYRTALKIVPAADPVRYVPLDQFLAALPPTARPNARAPRGGGFEHMLCDSAWVMFHDDLRERSLLRGFLHGSTATALAECIAECVTVAAEGGSDSDSPEGDS